MVYQKIKYEGTKDIQTEYKINKKEHDIKINDNNIRIELDIDTIKFIVIIGLSFIKYERLFNYDEIKAELNMENNKDIQEIYNSLLKNHYEILEKEKKLILDENKEIQLEEKPFTNEEIIRILLKEIKEIKENHKKEKSELMKLNEDKEKKLASLENKFNDLKEHLYEIDDIVNKDKYKNEINLI